MKEELRKELEDLGSSLEDLKHKQKHEIPDGFFERMQDEVILKMKKAPSSAIIRKIRFRSMLYGAAAVILLLVAAIFVWDQQANGKTGFDELDSSAVYAYLDDNIEEINLAMLVSEEVAEEEFYFDDQDRVIEDYLEENLEDLSIEDLEDIL